MRLNSEYGPGPRYQQVESVLKAAIECGQISPGGAIPPERALAEQLNVSRVTVRRAIDELVEQGLLVRRHGAGTFLHTRVEKQFAKLSSFSEDMVARGRVPSSRWISRAEGAVTPNEALSLGLSPGSSVLRFVRARYADGDSMALERSTIARFALDSVNDVEDSLYTALENSGNRPVRALQKLRAVLFDPATAEILDIQPGTPGLLIERRGYLADGRAVEMTESWYRGDSYDFVAELAEG
jgi:GntR family transcriptional regulator